MEGRLAQTPDRYPVDYSSTLVDPIYLSSDAAIGSGKMPTIHSISDCLDRTINLENGYVDFDHDDFAAFENVKKLNCTR